VQASAYWARNSRTVVYKTVPPVALRVNEPLAGKARSGSSANTATGAGILIDLVAGSSHGYICQTKFAKPNLAF
jgi:hypothetical protein